MLDKKLKEKTIDSYSSHVCLFGFYTQQSVVSLAWFLFVPEISFDSPLSEFEQHTYNSDPRPDTGSLMQLESLVT